MARKKKLPTEEAHDESLTNPAPKPFLNGFKKKRSLTLEVRSISKMTYAIFRCEGELVVSEMPSKFSKTGKAEATSVDVTDVVTGEQYTLVLNAVAASALKRAGTPLAGRHFEISVGGEHEGKRYRDTEVTELEEGN
jgi:hypothetical protein